MSSLVMFQMLSLLLLGLGLFGVLWRRSLVGMLIGVELMLNGAGLSIVASGQLTQASGVMAQAATLFIMGLAAAEAALVLAIIIVVSKRFGHTEPAKLNTLRG
jgi:NADH-quinone oxidoreductase subunit K